MENASTTIKLSKKTKTRLDNLKLFQRETYEEIITKMLDLMNLFKTNPQEAQKKLHQIDELKKSNK